MIVIRLITIFCLCFVVYSEGDLCCVKHKYVQDTRGVYIKKCVLGTTCSRGTENYYIFDEDFLAAQQNYVEQLKTSQNSDEQFQNYIKDNEDFVTFLHNYVTTGKTSEKYNNLVNKYQQLEDEYNNYIKEKFPNGDKVEENQKIYRNRRSGDRGQMNKQINYNLDEDYLVARRNYQGKLDNDTFQNFIKNKDLQNYVTGVKTMDKYTSLVNKYKQLQAGSNNHDKETFPNNDEVEENPDDIDTESKNVDGQNNYIVDEANLVKQQNYLDKLKEYADNYQKYDEKFQNFIKNYDNYVKELHNYVTGVKTMDKYTSLVNTHRQLDNEYNNYVKENFPKSDKKVTNQNTTEDTEDTSGDNTKVNNENKYITNKDYLVAQQNYLKKLKEYADQYQIDDKKFQHYLKHNEDFVKDLQSFVTGAITTDEYTTVLNKYQQIVDEYSNYVKEKFSNGDKIKENLNIGRKRRSTDTEQVDTQTKYILADNTFATQQNFLEKFKKFTDKYLKQDEKLKNFIKKYDNFVKELQDYVTRDRTEGKYASLINEHQQLTEEYNNYVKENFPNNDENENNIFVFNKDYLMAQENFVKQLKEYADAHQIHDEKVQNFIKRNEDYVEELQEYITGVKTNDKYTRLINKHEQLHDEYNVYVKKYIPNSDTVEENQNIIARKRRRSAESEEYSLYDTVNPDATEYEKCLWKYNKYGSTVCDQLKSLRLWGKLEQAFPFRDNKEYNSVVDRMEDARDMDEEDNTINILVTANGKSTNQNKRIDSLLTAAPNCFEGSGSLAHNNLCKLEFYDY